MFTRPYPPATPEELRALVKKCSYKSRFLQLVDHHFKHSSVDRKLIADSYEWNAKLFAGKRRLSGGSFMNGHLVPVAVLVLEYWQVQDAELVAAALSHDSQEDFPETVTRKLVAEIHTPRTARIVHGMTKPPLKGRAKNSVAFSQAIISRVAAHGVECVFLKCCADRPHNMITLWGTTAKKRWKLWETEQYFVPLARKFALPTEELSLAIADQRRRLHIDDS